MDGVKKIVSHSIEHRLSLSLSILVVIIGLLAGGYSFYAANNDAKEWQDNYLQQIFHIIEKQEQQKLVSGTQIFSVNNEIETNLYIAKLLPNQANVIISNRVLFSLTPNITEGLLTLVGDTGSYRIVTSQLPSGERLVVAQSTIERDELVLENTLNALIPIFLLVPLIILLLRKYIAYLFLPIKQASSIINKSEYDDFSAISLTKLPKEIHPFVISINELLARISDHISMQQRFIAEAAHELRTPLTALSLQAERLNSLITSEPAKIQLKVLLSGINRNKELVSQLLTLAKVQSNKSTVITKVLLPDIVKHVIEELMPLAEQKAIDIGVVESQPAYIQANNHELYILLRNLIENAIKYSYASGMIDISIVQVGNKAQVTILDCGPGISLSEIEQVFSPFYRGLGSETIGTGLGLSIVKAIIDKLNANIEMKFIENIGFQVTILFNSNIVETC